MDCGPWKILVVDGGTSAEREVSLESGRNVAEALRAAGHFVLQIDPATEDPAKMLQHHRFDIVVPMLHGTGGEDGVLQRQLTESGIPFLGSRAEAAALTFDKQATRLRLIAAGLPVPEGILIERSQVATAEVAVMPELPVVIKPVCQGSSVGVSIVRTMAELEPAITTAFQFDGRLLVERYIPGRELTVAVVDGESLPPIEIIPARTWYDYSAKYQDDETRYVIGPDDLPRDLEDIARESCRLCGVSGICRVDFRIDESGKPWFLEINTIPGMTSHSLVPMAARAAGLSVASLLEGCIRRQLHDSDTP
ncbi:MAG: D-alanine--D-alanine ligase, partial [Planctomycetaceae bacterium]|nr:D-alanine--D-alanine ligase [Planctomycetaceae bacterium]